MTDLVRSATSPLRAALDEAMAGQGSMKSLTVLAPQNDPFRVDTPAGHRDGAWLGEIVAGRTSTAVVHLRGLHYMVLGWTKPNGQPYTNTDADWTWLQNSAAKAARWLGYVAWERIADERNKQPIFIAAPDPVEAVIFTDLDVRVPSLNDLVPEAGLLGFTPRQAYRLALIGEKSSLEPALSQLASEFGADLLLPTGEASDTMLHRLAAVAAEDGRPLVVAYFSDCDPAGWQMPISTARKLQAFKASLFPALEFRVIRAGLTPDQVREFDLPSTPLKDSEKRADKWTSAMQVEQTEIDALAALRPELLLRIGRDALAPYFDSTLADRTAIAGWIWREEAQERIDAAMGTPEMVSVQEAAAARLDELRHHLAQLRDQLSVPADTLDLPPVPALPAAVLDQDNMPDPLVSSRWSFADQCRALINGKAYIPRDTAADRQIGGAR